MPARGLGRVAPLLLLLGVACDPYGAANAPRVAGTISASDYARTCASVADCFPVFEGQAACCMPCPNAAIRQDAFETFSKDFLRDSNCAGVVVGCSPLVCPQNRITCDDGVCGLATVPDAAPAPDGATAD